MTAPPGSSPENLRSNAITAMEFAEELEAQSRRTQIATTGVLRRGNNRAISPCRGYSPIHLRGQNQKPSPAGGLRNDGVRLRRAKSGSLHDGL